MNAFKSSDGTKRQRIKEGTYEQVNLACFKRLLIQRSENIPIRKKIIQEKALVFAQELNLEKFQASNGWLHSWKEAASTETSLPTILSRYELKDIYNADEFGLFYQGLPKKALHLKGEKCSGGKYSKVCLTGMVAASATREKLPKFVIGKSVKL